MTVSLLKYHGLGNDFLIALDPTAAMDRETSRYLCDRHRGIGADGLIIARPAQKGGDMAMELSNADGSPAETSGNGLRCFALALVDSGVIKPDSTAKPTVTVEIETDGGLVTAEIGRRTEDGCAEVSVTMGVATVGPVVRPAPLLGASFEARDVSVGNPHLVLLGSSIADLDGVDIATAGPELEWARPGGQNVEVVAPDGAGGLELLVWERGVGLTEACGSGSVAAAAAARASGVVGESVPVRNPGGSLVVELAGPAESPTVALSGPACYIARIEARTSF